MLLIADFCMFSFYNDINLGNNYLVEMIGKLKTAENLLFRPINQEDNKFWRK